MALVISIHEYSLKPGVEEFAFEAALSRARESGLLNLPGLEKVYFVKGLRGRRQGKYAAIWIYRSRQDWEKLWGPVDRPIAPEQYPDNWKQWEQEVLAPFLDRDPDRIDFTSYQELEIG